MIQNFLIYLQSVKGYSTNTVKSYGKDLAVFVTWIKEAKPAAHWRDISRDDIDAFVISQERQGMAAATTNRRLAAISSLYGYFRRQGLEVANPCKFESRRKIASRIPNTIPFADIKTAYEHAQGVAKFMLGMLATTGIRIQELLDLCWNDIDFDTCRVTINGKGQKQRIVYTAEEVLAEAKRARKMTAPIGKMFHISQREARYMLYNALAPYSTAKQLSPHAIRHSVATFMASEGNNVASIAKILGHSHLETTQKYIDLAQVSTLRTGVQL